MSNGVKCCLLGICCMLPQQIAALMRMLVGWTGLASRAQVGAETLDLEALAGKILAEVDLAPKGLTAAVKEHRGDPAALGAAVLALYEPHFAEAA